MFMIIIHIAYITCLVTNDAWHPYDVIGVNKIHHRAGQISYFAKQAGNTVLDWNGYTRSGPVAFNGASNIEVGKHGYGRGRGS